MPKKKSLILFIPVLLLLVISISVFAIKQLPDRKLAAHAIKPGQSYDNNPLKGFMPYSYADTDFPHSLEWFYIPMSFLYPDPASTPETKPTWTKLEKELNTVAERGHQAVFRIVIDYPSNNEEAHPFSLPQFLLNEKFGLKTYDYTEFDNFVSKIPDYSNPDLRNTIKNCITSLGEKYDGDKRIAFITGGFLGFWGEWHCWPYDADTNDGLPNYEPTTEVFNEVIAAYERSFKKTKILFRTPKGNSPSKTQFGFHDDSYCYSTMFKSEKGGNDWNFGELLRNAKPGCEDRWKTAPIGGELRPELQAAIFEKNEPWEAGPTAPGENWSDNLKSIHPSWMLNQGIVDYTGKTRENAITAGKQMGYDFRAATAYYADDLNSTDKIKLGVEIENIGVAPFYYNHTMWPVQVGIKQDDKVVSSWTTDWDLNKIEANGKTIRFNSAAPDKNNLKPGYYTICIKVVNPLPNGTILSFANEAQGGDGWLDLGLFTIDKGGSMPKPVAKPKAAPTPETEKTSDVLPVGTTYEAEVSDYYNGFIQISENPAYSGGRKIGYIGTDGGYLLFNNIKASKAGEHEMTIFYTTALERSAMISVNGEAPVKVDFKPTGSWTKVAQKNISVNLKAGDNTIKLYNDEFWAPDIDRIIISD